MKSTKQLATHIRQIPATWCRNSMSAFKELRPVFIIRGISDASRTSWNASPHRGSNSKLWSGKVNCKTVTAYSPTPDIRPSILKQMAVHCILKGLTLYVHVEGTEDKWRNVQTKSVFSIKGPNRLAVSCRSHAQFFLSTDWLNYISLPLPFCLQSLRYEAVVTTRTELHT